MPNRDESAKTLKITALSIEDAAKAIASAYGRRVTVEQVRQVAEAGGFIRPDGTINLLEYVAYLVQEVEHGPSAAPGNN